MTLHNSHDPSSPAGPTGSLGVNDVHLVGHLSRPVEMKEMPSGDLLGTWTLVVRRPPLIDPADEADAEGSSSTGRPGRRRGRSHDPIECVSFDIELIERLSDLAPRTRLDVRGALRRRFRRDQPGHSRYEVEAFTVAVLPSPDAVVNPEPVASTDTIDLAAPAGDLTVAG